MAGGILHVDQSAIGNNNGSTWENAYTNLQDALRAATPLDEVWVAEGVYYPDVGAGQTSGDRMSTFIIPQGVPVFGGFPRGGAAMGNRDTMENQTVLSGDIDANDDTTGDRSMNCYHVVTVGMVDTNTYLDGLVITGGNANGSEPHNYGGGVFGPDFNAALGLIDCYFRDNMAAIGGGAVWGLRKSRIEGCTFENNLSQAGGGALDHNPVYSLPIAQVIDCVFRGNQGGFGGAVNGAGSVENSLFIANSAQYGGAGSGVTTYLNCRFFANEAQYEGGALYGASAESCDFSGNRSGQHGGAVAIPDVENPIMLLNCRFRGNEADWYGGAVYLRANVHAGMEAHNCLFQGNRAGRLGGALGTFNQSSATLINCSLQGNSADAQGGGLYVGYRGGLTIRNTVAWNNQASGASATANSSLGNPHDYEVTVSNSLIEMITSGGTNLDGFDPSNDPNFLLPIDPNHAPSVVGDLRFASGSPLLDQGGNEWVSLSEDLQKSVRIQNSVVDIGAYEGDSTDPISEGWLDDPDGDGVPTGLELALGRNPVSAEYSDPRNLRVVEVNPGQSATLSLGLGSPPTGTFMAITRSTSLSTGDRELICLTTETQCYSSPEVAVQHAASGFIITDGEASGPRAFYYIEAAYAPPPP